MCGRFIFVETVESIEKRFNITYKGELQVNYNISPGQQAYVIANDKSKELQLFQFGLTPFWAKKRMYLFNARTEGDNNKENEISYTGSKGIILKPAFRKPIRSQRCLVIASGFIEGTTKEGLSKPYLVYLKEKVPFSMAGIWDEWEDQSNGEIIKSFSIITTTPNELIQKLPHHRMPVIISQHDENKWLHSNTSLGEITELLKQYPADKMNAYPISPDIKNLKNNSKELIQPTGERLLPEYEYKSVQKAELSGFGHRKKESSINRSMEDFGK